MVFKFISQHLSNVHWTTFEYLPKYTKYLFNVYRRISCMYVYPHENLPNHNKQFLNIYWIVTSTELLWNNYLKTSITSETLTRGKEWRFENRRPCRRRWVMFLANRAKKMNVVGTWKMNLQPVVDYLNQLVQTTFPWVSSSLLRCSTIFFSTMPWNLRKPRGIKRQLRIHWKHTRHVKAF